MITSYSNTTKAQRDEMVSKWKAEISDLKKNIQACEQKRSQLEEDNAENISKRDSVNDKIDAKKRTGGWVIAFGVLLAVIGLFFANNDELQFIFIAGIAAGIGLFLFGLVIRSGWKQYEGELIELNLALSDFDSETYELYEKAGILEKSVKRFEEMIEEVKEYEANEKYFKWAATTEKGHVAVFVTFEMKFGEDRPPEPVEGKKYDSMYWTSLKSLDIYLNDMLYRRASREEFRGQNGLFAILPIDEPGTNKLEVTVTYLDNVKGTDPLPMKKDSPSMFMWYHVSIAKTTRVYQRSYSSIEDFRKAVNLTRDEIMRKLS